MMTDYWLAVISVGCDNERRKIDSPSSWSYTRSPLIIRARLRAAEVRDPTGILVHLANAAL